MHNESLTAKGMGHDLGYIKALHNALTRSPQHKNMPKNGEKAICRFDKSFATGVIDELLTTMEVWYAKYQQFNIDQQSGRVFAQLRPTNAHTPDLIIASKS